MIATHLADVGHVVRTIAQTAILSRRTLGAWR
jgi:hypothetical protein